MPRTAARTAPATRTKTGALLNHLSAIAGMLAEGSELGDRVVRVLERAGGAIGARGCGIWIDAPDGSHPGWTAGERVRAEDVAPAAAPRDDIAVFPLRASGERFGALALPLAAPLAAEGRVFLETVANLLAPDLSHAAHSHRLEVEVELRAHQIDEERRFTQKIIDSLPVGLYVVDREYRVQAWNRKRETGMQGVSRDEAIGRPIFEILHRQPADVLRAEFDEVFETGRIQVFQMESKATGDTRTYRISKIPMRMGDGPVTHVITIGEDITDWKSAQERFAQAEKLAAIGQLAAGVMHEINNPLATIAVCAESLSIRLEDLKARGAAVPPDAWEFIRIVDGEVHRCKGIVEGLLDFSRPRPLTKAPVRVDAVVEQALFLMKHHARFKTMRVETTLHPALPPVTANAEQLVQVLMALLLNALDAMDGEGTVTISSRRGRTPREGVVVEVTDRGHGIPRSETSKIFEPFFTTKAPGRGTGLGLSICYAIVSEHGGRIEVDSDPGKGSTFRILLPEAAS